jgi:hypothetical protein
MARLFKIDRATISRFISHKPDSRKNGFSA